MLQLLSEILFLFNLCIIILSKKGYRKKKKNYKNKLQINKDKNKNNCINRPTVK
jgi:hypothetical protein